MKRLIIVFLGFCLLYTPALAGDKKDKKAIKSVVNEFMLSINKQDAEAAFNILISGFQGYVLTPKGINIMTPEQIKTALEGKKIGGEDRKIKIHSVDVHTDMAVSKVEASNEKGSFIWYLSLMKIEGVWKIVNSIATFEPA